MSSTSDDAIRQRAYQLWEADGRPDGKAEHYWSIAAAEAGKKPIQSAAKSKADATKAPKAKAAAATKLPKVKKAARPKKTAKKAEALSKKAATKPRAAMPAKKPGKKG